MSALPYSLEQSLMMDQNDETILLRVSGLTNDNETLKNYNLTRITVKIPDPRLEPPQCTSCCRPSTRAE